MGIRVVLYSQIIWISLIGALARDQMPLPASMPEWMGLAIAFFVLSGILFYPLAFAIVVACQNLSRSKATAFIAIECALCFAYVVALLPAFQRTA